MTKNVWNSLTAHERSVTHEVNNMPSLTVPDQTMSMREILDRYARGLPITGAKVAHYDEEDDMPDPRTLDLADRQTLAEEAKAEIKAIAKKQADSKKKKYKEQELPLSPSPSPSPSPDPSKTRLDAPDSDDK